MITPNLIYGTAWKEEETERLVRSALEAGFRAIDTANQRKHYHEAGVGAALSKAVADGVVAREDVFLQTKFTSINGQDDRLPYERHAAPGEQVKQSFVSSLAHLQVERIDSLVLHGPARRRGLAPEDLEVWSSMEEIQRAGGTRFLGVSNVALDQLELLLERATVRPRFVQNRCYARTGWDREIRAICSREAIVYQGFSLLTANAAELRTPPFRELVARLGRTPAQIIFRFAQQVGMLPLTGTTDAVHMREDLLLDFELSTEDVAVIERLAG